MPERRVGSTTAASVDVIVPVYNQRALVEACLASVLESRNETAFELIVVDDASSDAALRTLLARMAEAGTLTLLTNNKNLGFTKSVNRGMRLHPERDVLLLNSDTVVFGDWLDRLGRAARSEPKVATVNPLTNASHISCYPFRSANGSVTFEMSDQQLDAIAAEANQGRRVTVPTAVGFCLYIRRAALDAVGYFDEVHFPFGYGEETDFCYRARKLGWRHLVTGDVFVRHWEGQSFGDRKARAIAEMLDVFNNLHPDLGSTDREFARRDPVRPLRERLDLARLKLLLAGAANISCVERDDIGNAQPDPVLVFDSFAGTAKIVVPGLDTLPNLPVHVLPDDIAAFNAMLARLGVRTLNFAKRTVAQGLIARMRGRPMDLGLAVDIVVDDGVGMLANASPGEQRQASAPIECGNAHVHEGGGAV